jgi:hypothetical protein
LEDYRRKLFEAGFMGAYSFPAAAPLALLSRPLSKEDLKKIAREIRGVTLSKDGKITATGTGLVRCPENTPFEGALCGPLLDISAESLSGLNNEKTLYIFPKIILCAAIVSNEQIPAEFPELSFRAAMVSNLAISPLKSGVAPYSLRWRLGQGCWLPAHSRCFKHKAAFNSMGNP